MGKKLPDSLSELFLYAELTTEPPLIAVVCHNGSTAWLGENVRAGGAL